MFITRRYPLFLYAPDGVEGGDAGQAPSVETPENANTPEGTGTPTDQQAARTNWEERYREAQSWGTKSAQEAAELREYKALIDDWNSDDPDAQRRAAERLGIQLDEEEADAGQEYAQLSPADRKLLDDFNASRTEQQQTQQQEQQYNAYRADVDPQLKTMGIPEDLHELVAEAALQLPGLQTPQGLRPDLQGAVAQIEALGLSVAKLPSVQTKFIENYRKTKRAPAISSSGTAGTQVPDLDKRQDRIDWIVEQAQAQEQ